MGGAMTEPITTATEEARPVEPRRLHPSIAFLGGVIGLGYWYVGHISYAIAFVVAQYLYAGDRVVADTWRYRDAPPAFGDAFAAQPILAWRGLATGGAARLASSS